VLGWLADVASVVTRRVFGFNANRRTEENVLSAGLDIEDVRRDGSGERSSPGRGYSVRTRIAASSLASQGRGALSRRSERP